MTICSHYARALTVAGSDSGGGAGIQADLKTFAALQCYGASVITSLTAQNTQTVEAVFPVSAAFVCEQLDAVLADIGTDSIKTGMLYSADIINVVAERLAYYPVKHIILDPVIMAKSGDKLLQDGALIALKQYLIPMADMITPNIPEAEILTGIHIQQEKDLQKAAAYLVDLGAKTVVIKGGHAHGKASDDFVYSQSQPSVNAYWLKGSRILSRNIHGTGCTFSSAIAAYLARGYAIKDALAQAKDYVTKAIREGTPYSLGQGYGPVHHFFEFWS